MDITLHVLAVIIVLLLIIDFVTEYKKRNLLTSETVISGIQRVEQFLKDIEQAKKDYIVHMFHDQIKQEYEELYILFSKKPFSTIKDKRITNFMDVWINLDSNISKWNEEYIQNEIEANKDLFDNIDGKSLDEQQRKAIVVDEINNLVLAGAGSGKTLTIAGKVKYLVERKNIPPKDILLISFTRKAAEEMQRRIKQRLGIEVDVKTFHKLGLDIITKKEKQRPDVFEVEDLKLLLDEYFQQNIYEDKTMITNLITFFACYLNIPKDWEEFENLGEYHDYCRSIKMETLRSKAQMWQYLKGGIHDLKANMQTIQGEYVKSLEEVIIANFLFLNGIDYIYESKYPFPSPEEYRKPYTPDFYLPEYNIYIEHFGINEHGRVPWLTEIEEKKYLDGIQWKRYMHKKNRTILLETYSYFNKQGLLLTKLEKMLKEKGVVFREIDVKEIYNRIFDKQNDRYFDEFKKLISTFIGLFKSNGYGIEDFSRLKKEVKKCSNDFLRQRSMLFLDIVKPLYKYYEDYLKDSGKIDFNDMINHATEIVKTYPNMARYKYIIIDEYQDISVSRYKLIKTIKDCSSSKLMCVGDDWQSIYRFTGSDIDLLTSFDKYFGYYELLKIERTYRNSQQLINITGKFIMKNAKQLKKELKSEKELKNPVRIFGYKDDICTAIKKAINEIINLYGKEAEILILGRHNFDIDLIKPSREFRIKYGANQQIKINYRPFPELKISYLTVHKAKGTEADNVIIINASNKTLGFPNKIADDPVLSLVLADSDSYDLAEERRLFYVALTRTKNTVYIIAPDRAPSVFVEELIRDQNITCEFATNEESISDNPKCPKCKSGNLIIRENSANKSCFLGCSNFPGCDYTINDIEILKNQIICKKCSGYMVKRNGKHGEFYACSNYPYCKYIIDIDDIITQLKNSR